MTDQSRIILDPDVLAGKPIIRGTRLSVDFIIGLLADGWVDADILRTVESRRGAVAWGLLRPSLRFPSPLIEPDLRVSLPFDFFCVLGMRNGPTDNNRSNQANCR
jgi:hypothetical protein